MRPLSGLSLLCFFALAGASTLLEAAETSFGLQGGIMFPTGDLKTLTANSTGIGVGTHLLVDLGNGHTVRPRLDYFSFPGKTGHYKLQSFSGGADYVYFMEGKLETDFYLVAGAGMVSNTLETFQPGYSRSYNNPYLALGAGYQFTRLFGLELRYSSSRFTQENGGTSTVNSFGVSGTVRF